MWDSDLSSKDFSNQRIEKVWTFLQFQRFQHTFCSCATEPLETLGATFLLLLHARTSSTFSSETVGPSLPPSFYLGERWARGREWWQKFRAPLFGLKKERKGRRGEETRQGCEEEKVDVRLEKKRRKRWFMKGWLDVARTMSKKMVKIRN